MPKTKTAQPAPSRPPIVTILGHVDHGKTSLLDYLRKTKLQKKEIGGITQGISAYQISYQNRLITFIDTPGHSAFTKMRQQGGNIADIAILVIAADDAVMPQTKESLKLLQESQTPFLVAVNKIDLPDANSLKTKTQLSELGVYVEGFGGNTPVVEISAKTGQNIDALLETLLLMADLEELPSTSSKPMKAIVLEAFLDSAQGSTVTVIVKSGVLRIQDHLFVGLKPVGKVRSMRSFLDFTVHKALPSTPVQIIGFSVLPQAGDIISTSPTKPSLASIVTHKQTSERNPLVNIILKCDVLGSLEAIKSSLSPQANLIDASTGAITDADINLAQMRQAEIISFNVKLSASVKKMVQFEKVKITQFNIIYELLDYVGNAVEEKLSQIQNKPQETASLEVLKIFTPNRQKILGCIVLSGKLKKTDLVEGSQIVSLKIGKDDVDLVKKDQECGILLKPELDAKVHDILKSYN